MNNQSLNDGGPAFPSQFVALPGSGFDKGMSLRDYFAAACLGSTWQTRSSPMPAALNPGYVKQVANECYVLADAMLKERAEPAKE